MLYRLLSPYFCCGVITDPDGWIVKAAPIVKYMIGWHETKMQNYAEKKKWKVEQCQ